MIRALRLLALAPLLLAGTDAVSAGDALRLTTAPIDLRPAIAVKKRVARAVPLPRLRPDYTPEPDLSGLPDEVSPEIVGSIWRADGTIAPPNGVLAATPPGAGPPMVIASSADAAPAALPPPARPVASAPIPKAPLMALVRMETPESDGLGGDPALPFVGKPTVEPGASKVDRLPAPSPAPSAPIPVASLGEPFQLVRTLQSLQDKIAQGSTEALVEQRALRARMDAEFAAAGAAVWQDKRNAAAAVTYVLSGGAPAILTRMKTLDPRPAVDERLLGGALAYVEGDEAEASKFLGEINAFDLPPSMAGLVALAQSALAVRTDPEKAIRLLDLARLLAPGTLVEEGAIRREIFIADQLKDGNKVESLGRQYLQRFRHSVYAGNFRNRFAAAISHLDLATNADRSERLDDMLAAVEPAARCQLYLTFALAAVVKGNAEAATLAADRAADLAELGSNEAARARLYRAAGRLAVAASFNDAVADFGAVGRDVLPPSDQALYDVVSATIAGIESGTDQPAAASAKLDATDTELTPLFTRAAESLKTADALLAAAE